MTGYVDHLVRYPDEAAAIADLAPWRAGGAWVGNILPGVHIVYTDAVWGDPDPETGERSLVTPAVLGAEWYAIIATHGLDAGLAGREACILITDRDAAIEGRPFVLRSGLEEAALAAVLRVEPTYAGSAYPFGSPVRIGD